MNQENRIVIINIPLATPNTIIFPSSGQKFDSAFYSPALTDKRLSFEEINEFLTELETVRAQTASKLPSDNFCWKFTLYFDIFLLMCGLALLFLKRPNFIIFLILAALYLIVHLAEYGVNKLREARNQRVRNELRTKCEVIVRRYNQNLAARGLRWCLPALFPRWVELWKDYNQNQGQENSNVYIPPSQY